MIKTSFAIVIREEGPSFEELAEFIISRQPRDPWDITRLDEMLCILAGEKNDRWGVWFDDIFAASLRWPQSVFCVIAIKEAPGTTNTTYFRNGQYYDEPVEAQGFDPLKLAIQSRFDPKTTEYVTARVRKDIAEVLNDLDQELHRPAPMLMSLRESKANLAPTLLKSSASPRRNTVSQTARHL